MCRAYVYDGAHEEAQKEYEMRITRDPSVELYEAAVVKCREAAEAKAHNDVREGNKGTGKGRGRR